MRVLCFLLVMAKAMAYESRSPDIVQLVAQNMFTPETGELLVHLLADYWLIRWLKYWSVIGELFG